MVNKYWILNGEILKHTNAECVRIKNVRSKALRILFKHKFILKFEKKIKEIHNFVET